MDNNMGGDRTTFFDESMLSQYQNPYQPNIQGQGQYQYQASQGQKKNTLVIVDRDGVHELDLSEHADAVYTFGRKSDNSIVFNSEIVSGQHGE